MRVVLDDVAGEVFDHRVDPALAREFLADPRHHLVVACAGTTVVGMATALHYVHPDKPTELWINEIGVAPAYRRRGIGTRLLEALFAHGRAIGCREAWLGTEESNLAARRLYAKVARARGSDGLRHLRDLAATSVRGAGAART